VFTLLLLEVVARLAMPGCAPVRVRDGYFQNPLPLITGAPLSSFIPDGERLAEEKGPGELRVAVLGESSVAGAPLDVHAALPAMLYDQLVAALPDRAVTVVNMGRPGSVSANVYYYLLFLRRFAPDVIVFYMGMNDSVTMGGEQCVLVRHSAGHAVWRWFVERSWLLWTVRTWGPQMVWSVGGGSNEAATEGCEIWPFPQWTDLLVATARAMGAEVVIATPVANAAGVFEASDGGPRDRPATAAELDALPAVQRELLTCELTPGCDFPAVLRRALEDEPGGSDLEPLWESGWVGFQVELALRGRVWERAARRHGAQYIPFHDLLAAQAPHLTLTHPYLADALRLRPATYYWLAGLIRARIVSLVQGGAPADVPFPDAAAVAPYLLATEQTGVANAFYQLQRRAWLTAVPGLEFAVASFADGPHANPTRAAELRWARLTLAWMQRSVGVEPALPPDLAAELDGFDPLRGPTPLVGR
jgi:hypothetical protein